MMGVTLQHNIKICCILVRYKDYMDVCSNIWQLMKCTVQGIPREFMR